LSSEAASPADFYDSLTPHYHLGYADWGASIHRQGAALRTILEDRGVPPGSSVLDGACGIGTQSLGLAAEGYRVTASDVSARAVERARSEAAARGLAIAFSVADLRGLAEHHGRSFDAVIACDNAIPHLLSDAEILQALGQMWRCTRPGGVAAISVRDYAAEDLSIPLQAQPPLLHADANLRWISFQVWQIEGSRYELSVYIVRDAPPAPTVQVMRTRYYAVSIQTLTGLMSEAGFRPVERLDSPFFQPVLAGLRPG
jgi:SAM-dependent methyltransferase